MKFVDKVLAFLRSQEPNTIHPDLHLYSPDQVRKAIIAIQLQVEPPPIDKSIATEAHGFVICPQCKHDAHMTGLCEFGLADGDCPCDYECFPVK